MDNRISTKSGKSSGSPALFPNPQTGPEGEYVRKLLTRYETESLEGVVVNLEDWDTVSDRLRIRQTSLGGNGNSKPIEDRLLLINPDFSPLFGYSRRATAEKFAEFDFLPSEARETVDEIFSADGDQEKREIRRDELHPAIDNIKLIQDVMEFQIDKGADVVAPPSIPITTKGDFDDRLELIKDIYQTSQGILDGRLLSSEPDLMHVLSVNPSVMETPENDDNSRKRWERAVDAVTEYNPDWIGIHIPQMNMDDRNQNQNLLNAINNINERTNANLILLNVREFGIVSFVYGMDIISPPIASFPYPRWSSGAPATDQGKYYHPEDLEDYSKEELREETRNENYRFPCYCEVCEEHERIPEVDDDEWNEFRRIHYLLIKDSEIKQLRENNKSPVEALRDKLGNSARTNLVAYLP